RRTSWSRRWRPPTARTQGSTRLIARRTLLAAAASLGLAGPALALPQLGQPAPAFTAIDAAGKSVSLSQFAGKTVVLEWTHSGCQEVGKHYASGSMQSLQKKETGEGVVWLTVASSAPGMQGYFTPATANRWAAREHWSGTSIVLDPAGKVGRAYGARNTP